MKVCLPTPVVTPSFGNSAFFGIPNNGEFNDEKEACPFLPVGFLPRTPLADHSCATGKTQSSTRVTRLQIGNDASAPLLLVHWLNREVVLLQILIPPSISFDEKVSWDWPCSGHRCLHHQIDHDSCHCYFVLWLIFPEST